jgi:hypothetical protein
VRITSSICGELGIPPLAIGLGKSTVCGAAMPETTIDKNSDFSAGENDVGPGTQS